MNKLALAAALVALITTAAAADNGLATRASKYSVAETMDRLEAAVRAAGDVQVIARVDFQALAATQGGTVRPEQLLIFGRGGVLEALLPSAPTTAIDLPIKALAWEDAQGKVWLAYNTAAFYQDRHVLAGKDEVLKKLTGFTESFVKKALD